MGNSTFSGPVRSENGFQVVSRNATTGAITTVADTASTGIVTNKYVKHVGFATVLLLTQQRVIVLQLVSLRSQQIQSSLTLRFFVMLLLLLEQVTLGMRLEHLVQVRKLLLL